jgi:microcystin-dependent protein
VTTFTYTTLPAVGQTSADAANNIISCFSYVASYLNGSNISSSQLDTSALNAAVPVGTIIPWAGNLTGGGSVPSLWVVCDGSELSQSTYSLLYSVVGSLYGSASAGNFKLPDLRGRFPVGYTASGGHADVSTVGASDSVSLASRTPKHSHTVPAHYHGKGTLAISTGGSHAHTVPFDITGNYVNSGSYTNGSTTSSTRQTIVSKDNASGGSASTTTDAGHVHAMTGSIGATGGSNGDDGSLASTSGAGPYLVLPFIIKHGKA